MKTIKYALSFAVFLGILYTTPASASWRGIVETVTGCGFILIKPDGGPAQGPVRLHGIQCPDCSSGQGQNACETLLQTLHELLPKGSKVIVHDMKRDAVGSFTGSFITLPNGNIVQEELLKAGLAKVSARHCGSCWKWKKLEKEAQDAGLGFWKEETPWESD